MPADALTEVNVRSALMRCSIEGKSTAGVENQLMETIIVHILLRATSRPARSPNYRHSNTAGAESIQNTRVSEAEMCASCRLVANDLTKSDQRSCYQMALILLIRSADHTGTVALV